MVALKENPFTGGVGAFHMSSTRIKPEDGAGWLGEQLLFSAAERPLFTLRPPCTLFLVAQQPFLD